MLNLCWWVHFIVTINPLLIKHGFFILSLQLLTNWRSTAWDDWRWTAFVNLLLTCKMSVYEKNRLLTCLLSWIKVIKIKESSGFQPLKTDVKMHFPHYSLFSFLQCNISLHLWWHLASGSNWRRQGRPRRRWRRSRCRSGWWERRRLLLENSRLLRIPLTKNWY